MMQRGATPDEPKGVQVSGFTDACSMAVKQSGIEKGMVIVKLNGEVVEHASYTGLVAKIKAGGRPLKMNFSAPMELVNGLKAKAQKIAAIAKKKEELAQLDQGSDGTRSPPPPAPSKEQEEKVRKEKEAEKKAEERRQREEAKKKEEEERQARQEQESLDILNAHRDPEVHRLAEEMRELNVRLEEVQQERISCPRKGKAAKARDPFWLAHRGVYLQTVACSRIVHLKILPRSSVQDLD